jgi:hypothetical protein
VGKWCGAFESSDPENICAQELHQSTTLDLLKANGFQTDEVLIIVELSYLRILCLLSKDSGYVSVCRCWC